MRIARQQMDAYLRYDVGGATRELKSTLLSSLLALRCCVDLINRISPESNLLAASFVSARPLISSSTAVTGDPITRSSTSDPPGNAGLADRAFSAGCFVTASCAFDPFCEPVFGCDVAYSCSFTSPDLSCEAGKHNLRRSSRISPIRAFFFFAAGYRFEKVLVSPFNFFFFTVV
jgi:hypothetical protein